VSSTSWYVAGDANGFGGGGHPAQAETRGSNAFAHNGASGQRNIFRVLDDGNVERAAIFHDLTGELRGGYGVTIVGNRDDASFFHAGNFGDGFAFAANAGRADGPDANAASIFGAVENEARDAGVIVDRFRIRHAADGGEASTRSGTRPRFDSFRRFLAGLPQMCVQIDETGSYDESGSVEDFGGFVLGREFTGCSEFTDFFAVEKNIARSVGLRGRVEGTRPFLIRSMRKVLFVGGAAVSRRL